MSRTLLHQLKQLKWLYYKPAMASLLIIVSLTLCVIHAKATPTHKYFYHYKADVTITGRVTDSSGQPLQGVSVSIAGTKIGTLTDGNGNYALSVPNDYTGRSLTFSYTGFVMQQVIIGDKRVINVSLKTDTGRMLSDVVVVGYGTQRRADLTGAVDVVSSKDIENKPVTNVLQALQGEAPNLIIQQTALDPGSNVNINIRGLGTLGDNTPLVVIDGIVGGNINTINPNDIASVTVLKDAGSAAIYGSRAANGVILITTKSGKLNQKPTISYDGSYGLQNPSVPVQKVSAWDNA